MPSRQHRRHTLENTRIVLLPHKPDLRARRPNSLQPFLIRLTNINRTLKRPRPLGPRGIVMRMRNHNSMQPTEGLDLGNRLLVQERYEIPEDIPFRGLQETGAFSYGELKPQNQVSHIPSFLC